MMKRIITPSIHDARNTADNIKTRYFKMHEVTDIPGAVGPYSFRVLEYGQCNPTLLTFDPATRASIPVGAWHGAATPRGEKK